MDNITASEVAGYGVGALLLCATIAAPKLDAFIASSQRRSLGMCKRCGDLKMIACSSCKGLGSIRKDGNFFSNLVDDFYESMEGVTKTTPMAPCVKCQSKGRIVCPECLRITRVIQ